MNGYRAALAVYVVWHPEFKRGEEIANRLYLHFAQDGSLPGIRQGVGVPVFFRSAPAGTGAEPAAIELTQAEHSVIVPLVDRKMVEAADQGWENYFARLLPRLSGYSRFLMANKQPKKGRPAPLMEGGNRILIS
jgi:hypothetical protein